MIPKLFRVYSRKQTNDFAIFLIRIILERQSKVFQTSEGWKAIKSAKHPCNASCPAEICSTGARYSLILVDDWGQAIEPNSVGGFLKVDHQTFPVTLKLPDRYSILIWNAFQPYQQ